MDSRMDPWRHIAIQKSHSIPFHESIIPVWIAKHQSPVSSKSTKGHTMLGSNNFTIPSKENPPPPEKKKKTPDFSNVPPHHRKADPSKHADWSNPRKAARYLFLSLNAWNQINPNERRILPTHAKSAMLVFREKMPSLWGFKLFCDLTIFDSFFQFQLKKLLGVTVSLLTASSHQNMWTQRCAVTDKIEMPRGGSLNDGSLIHFGLSDVPNMMQVMPQLPWRFLKCK